MKNLSQNDDIEQGLLKPAKEPCSYSYGAIETTSDDDHGEQHTVSCSCSTASSVAAREMTDTSTIRTIDSESSPLIVLFPDQPSVSSDDSSSQECSDSDSSCQKQAYHNYHDYDITNLATEHLEWTVSESTGMTTPDEEKTGCCSFRNCGRGLRVPGWEAYNKYLDTNPLFTKACTSLCGWFLGDFVTQTVITRDPFDVRRSATLASFGFLFHGPVGHFVYDNLDQIIVGTGPKEIAAKIFVDQVLWCPIFMVCYFTYLGLANGDSGAMILEKIHDDIFTAITGSWKLWPVAHAIQFRYVATKHRIVYINCIEVCFIMFLSFLGNQ